MTPRGLCWLVGDGSGGFLPDSEPSGDPFPFLHSHGDTGWEFPRLCGVLLEPFQHRIPRRIFPVPPEPAVFD